MHGRVSDAAYFMSRAREEARLAMMVEEPAITAAHHGLSVQYLAQARRVLRVQDAAGPSAFPQLSRD